MNYQHVPRFIVHLDGDPEKRWTHVIETFVKTGVLKVAETYLDSFFQNQKWMQTIVEKTMSMINDCGYVFYHKELQAISKISGIPVGKLVLLQLVYEAAACCTSIVDTNQNRHLRTMDWASDFLKQITIELDCRRKDRTVFLATSWVGYVGILTGMKPGRFSVAINFRTTLKGSMWDNLKEALITYAWPIGFLTRHALDQCDTYEEALSILSKAPLIAPCYISICGNQKGLGTVLTRNRQTTEPIQSIKTDGFYLIQTNLDSDQVDVKNSAHPNILLSRERVQMARFQLSQPSYKDPWKVLSVAPILNEVTIYSCVMDVAKGKLETRVPFSGISLPLMMPVNRDESEIDVKSFEYALNHGRHYIIQESTFKQKKREHCGKWHACFDDCSVLTCAYHLGVSRIGLQHWSCCYETNRKSQCLTTKTKES